MGGGPDPTARRRALPSDPAGSSCGRCCSSGAARWASGRYGAERCPTGKSARNCRTSRIVRSSRDRTPAPQARSREVSRIVQGVVGRVSCRQSVVASPRPETWEFKHGSSDDRQQARRRAGGARGEAPRERDAQVVRDVQAGVQVARQRGLVHLSDARSLPHLLHPRQGLQDLLGRRARDQRLPQRLRLHGAGARAPGHRRDHQEALRAGHPVRPAHRGLVHRGRAPGQELPPAQVALRELRLRGHHGRHPHRPGLHGPGAGAQDLRLLSWPSRLRDGEPGRRRFRRHRSPRQLQVDLLRGRHPQGRRST